MDGIRTYIFTIAVAAILSAVVMSIIPEGGGRQSIVKMICGLFLLVTVCMPIGEMSGVKLDSLEDFQDDAQQIESDTKAQLEQELATVIRQKAAAYIEDKAAEMGAELAVEVTLGEDMLPWEITLTGRVSPYAKKQLAEQIQQDLAISEQRQVWQP